MAFRGNETNWVLTGIAAATPTALVEDYPQLSKPVTVNTVRAVNTTAGAIDVSLSIQDTDGNHVVQVLPVTSLAAGDTLEVPSTANGLIVLKDKQNLMAEASATGVEFVAFGSY